MGKKAWDDVHGGRGRCPPATATSLFLARAGFAAAGMIACSLCG
jgi:hypothetical protein